MFIDVFMVLEFKKDPPKKSAPFQKVLLIVASLGTNLPLICRRAWFLQIFYGISDIYEHAYIKGNHIHPQCHS